MNSNNLIKISMILLLVAVAISSRLLNIIPNFAPIGAIALLFGAYLKSYRNAILLTFLVMFIGDILLSLTNAYPLFYSGMAFVYMAFFLIVLLGAIIKNRSKNIINIVLLATTSSVVFFIISNFGTWLTTNMYTKDFQGLVQCYIMGIPFYKYTFISDIVFAISFFVLWKVAFGFQEDKTAKQVAQ